MEHTVSGHGRLTPLHFAGVGHSLDSVAVSFAIHVYCKSYSVNEPLGVSAASWNVLQFELGNRLAQSCVNRLIPKCQKAILKYLESID
jgi:hypothetical protein